MSESRLARRLLRLRLAIADRTPKSDEEAYRAIRDDLRRKHRPALLRHDDLIDQAANLKWRLQKLTDLETAIVGALERSVSPEAGPFPQGLKDLLEILLKHNGLEKLEKLETKLREREKGLDEPLGEIADFRFRKKVWISTAKLGSPIPLERPVQSQTSPPLPRNPNLAWYPPPHAPLTSTKSGPGSDTFEFRARSGDRLP